MFALLIITNLFTVKPSPERAAGCAFPLSRLGKTKQTDFDAQAASTANTCRSSTFLTRFLASLCVHP